MKTFKEYTSNQGRDGKRQEMGQAQDAQTAADAEQLTRRIAAAYNGKSNADMWRSIAAEAERSRRAGTLTMRISIRSIKRFPRCWTPLNANVCSPLSRN